MGMPALFAISAGIQVASGIAGYAQQKKADRAAKNAAFAEAAIMEEDAKRAALQERMEADRVRKMQKVAYLTSGVDLEGSPLLVMEETRNKGAENAKNVTDSAAARASLTRQQGSVGRASLIGSLSNTVSGLAGTYTNYSTINSQQSKSSSSSALPWQSPGNVRPSYLGGGKY